MTCHTQAPLSDFCSLIRSEATASVTRGAASTRRREARLFLDEALRMREFDHPNILRLIGICIDDCSESGQGQGQPLVVLPYMQHGDLLAFLRDENRVRTRRTDQLLTNFSLMNA